MSTLSLERVALPRFETADVSEFSQCLTRVLNAVFERREKPALGAPPIFAAPSPAIPHHSGLTSADAAVMHVLFEQFLANGRQYVQPGTYLHEAAQLDVDASTASESIEILANEHLAEILRYMGPGPYLARLTPMGVSRQLGANENSLVRDVGLGILNGKLTTATAIAQATGHPSALVSHAIDRLMGAGHIKASHVLSGDTIIFSQSVTLRRMLAI